jgi:hypothetical protein
MNPGEDEMAALRFIINEQKAQLDSEKRVLERRKEEANPSSHLRANLSSYYSSDATQRSQSPRSPRSKRHHLARNLEAEFNKADMLPKTRDVAIMVTAAYIAANAPNDDEHMAKLRALALEGVRVLQTANEPTRDPTPRRNAGTAQHNRHQPAAPGAAPRPQIVQPINDELRHALTETLGRYS